MADNKYGSYSFYVPPNDKKLTEFIGAQSNISRTIQMLLKAFVYNYEGEYPDVISMDLKELIDNTNPDPEKLAEISDEINNSRKRKLKAKEEEEQQAAAAMAKEEVVRVVDDDDEDEEEEDDESKDEDNGLNVENAADVKDVKDDSNSSLNNEAANDKADEFVESKNISGESRELPKFEDAAVPDGDDNDDVVNVDNDDDDDDDDDVNVSVADDVPDDSNIGSGNESSENDQSEAETNLRDKYNKQQDAAETASPDDIMSLMGDM